MLNIRQRVFVIIGIIAGIVLALVLGIRFFKSDTNVPASEIPVTENGAVQQAGTVNTGTPEPQAIPREVRPPDETYALQMAKLFVERFGTYSNQNDNAHIDDVMGLSTPVMQRWLKTQMMVQSDTYSGYTTTVVASSVTSLTATAADIHVDVQERVEGAEDKIAYRSGRVTLVKQNNDWKVDGLYWDKE